MAGLPLPSSREYVEDSTVSYRCMTPVPSSRTNSCERSNMLVSMLPRLRSTDTPRSARLPLFRSLKMVFARCSYVW